MPIRNPYIPKDWSTGEVIQEADLDHIEQGIYGIDQEIIAARDGEDSLLDKINSIEDTMKDLTYKPIEISTFSISSPASGIAELGSTISTVNFSFSLNKQPASLKINNSSISTSSKTYSLTGQNIAAQTTFTLEATDSGSPSILPKTVTKDSILYFYNRIYYGVAAIPSTINSSFVTNLSEKVLSGTKARTVILSPGTNQYIWYAVPTRLRTCTFNVGGFEGGFETPQTVSVTNSSGYTENYYVYRSTNVNLGSNTTIKVS